MASNGNNLSDVPNTLASLNGITKVVYANKFQNTIPDAVEFSKRVKWQEGGTLGKFYEMPVDLALPQGVTYAAPNSGAFAINDMAPGFSDTAQINSSQILFVDGVDYESAAKAVEKGKAAVESAVTKVISRAQQAAAKRVELSMLYGSSSLGVVGSLGTTSGTVDSQGYYSRDVAIRQDTWASGIWLGMANSKVEFRVLDATTGAPTATKRGTATMLLGGPDVNNRTLRIRCTSNTDLNAITVGDGIIFQGTYQNEMIGLDRICKNKGLLWGIDGANWPDTWTGNTVDLGGREMNLRRLYETTAPSIAKGLKDVTLTAFINPITWGNMLANEASLVRHAQGGGTANNGFKSLKFQGQHGAYEFVPYICIKEGEAFIGPMETLGKVGAQDLELQAVPGQPENYWKPMEGRAGCEVRWYANLALFCDQLTTWTKVTGILNQQ